MKHLSLRLVAPLVSLALLGPAAAWAQSSHGAGHAASAAGASHDSQQMHQAMMSGMESMRQMKPSGDTDKDFAMMMKMHHQQAVEMAQAEVQHGKSPELKAMAQKMIKEQRKEIEKLDRWLKQHP
ncbi:MAG: DUF305 domain-containing protein [Roseateles sp.]|nr:DUF305 domain-containing protein [Pseudoxanthomonas sp.]